MKALKFYDKQGVAFELYLDYENQSVTMQVEDSEAPEDVKFVEFEDDDIDDVIIALVELKNELITIRNIRNN
jgi:hypothetical protein